MREENQAACQIIRIDLQNDVRRNGNTTQKYSRIQIRNINCTITESTKNIQYLPTDSLSRLFSMINKILTNISITFKILHQVDSFTSTKNKS